MAKLPRIIAVLALSTFLLLALFIGMQSAQAQPIPPADGVEYDTTSSTANQPSLNSSDKKAPLEVLTGDRFTYTIALVNSDTVSDASSTTVSDTLPTGVSYVSGTLSATSGTYTPTTSGIEWSGVVTADSRVTITFAVLATASPGEFFTNTAIISDADLSTPVTVTAVTDVAQPDLSTSSKSASVNRFPEDEVVDYEIIIHNSGGADAHTATMSDTIPTGVAYVPGSAWATDGIVTGTASAVEWQGTVDANDAVTVSFAVSVTATAGNTVTNTAIISDTALDAPVVVSVTNSVIPYVDFDFTKVVLPAIAEPGDTLTYTLHVTNTGRVTATDTQLVDWIPNNTSYNNDAVASRAGLVSSTTGITWTGDLDVSEGAAITFSVQISDTYHGFVTNTATLSQTYLPQPMERQVVATGIPILSLRKRVLSPAPPAPVGPGKELTYKLTVQNDGSIASGLLITDRLPLSTTFQSSGGTYVTSTGVVSWTPSLTLATGDEAVFTFTVQVSPTVVSGTVIVNDDYRVTSAEGAKAVGSVRRIDVKDPILAISKGATPDPPGANRALTYKVWVYNEGSLATDLVITDVVPTEAGVITYTSGGTYNPSTDLVTWTWPSLAFGKSKVFTYQVEVGNVPSGTEIVNGGYEVSCNEGITAAGGPLTSTIEPPILETSYKYADPIAVKPGDSLDFVIVLEDTGASNAIGATVTDTYHVSTATFESWAASSGNVHCTSGGWQVCTWDGDILHDQPVYITLTTKINSDLKEVNLPNHAYIMDDLLAETHIVSTTAKVTNYPALALSKSDEPDPVAPGRFITYTLTVRNDGLPTNETVVLTDAIPANTTYATSDGSYISSTKVVTWALPKLSTGASVQRMLVVQAGDVPGTSIYNDECVVDCGNCLTETQGTTVTTQVKLPLQASKEVTPGLIRAGELLTFTVAVENVFGETARQTTISDTIPEHTDYVVGSLDYPFGTASDEAAIQDQGYFTWSGDIPPYETAVVTFQARVHSSFTYGKIQNTAVVSQANLVYRPLTAQAEANVSTNPVLELSKKPSATTIEPLSHLTYTLHLTNAGREATDIVITDSLPMHTSYLVSAGGEQDGTLITEPTEIVSWTWPLLEFGKSISVTLVVSVSNVPSGTQIINDDYAVSCFEGVSTPGEPVTTTTYVPEPPTAPDVVAISPDETLNLNPLTTTITGSDFVATPEATLDGTSLAVTWVDSSTLTATVPAGIAPGIYDLTVTNDDEIGTPFDVLTDAFTVTNHLDHFIFGPIPTQTAGIPFTITLTAVDAFGHLVSDYTDAVTLTDETGTISPTVSPDFVNGEVSFTATITEAATGIAITATDDTITGTSNDFTLEPGTFAGFAFDPIPQQTVDEPFTVTIWVADRFGNATTGYTGTAALTDTTGTISPTVTGAFDGSMWSGTVTIGQLTSATLITATGGGFSGASDAVIVGNPNPDLTAITPDTLPNLTPQDLTITGTNFITPVSAFVGTTALTVTSATSTQIAAVVPAGLAPGLYDVRVANAGPGAPSDVLTDALTITNALDHFTLSPVLTQTAGVSFTMQIAAEDIFGWTVIDYADQATLSDSTGTLSPTSTPTFTTGIVTTTLTITQAQSDVVITAQDDAYTGTSNAFDVVAGPQARFAFDPLSTQTAGVPFTVTITAVDKFGNRVTTYNGTNVLSDTTGTITPTQTPAFVNGAVQFTAIITQAQSDVVISTGIEGSLFLPFYGSSDPFDVIPGPLTHIYIDPSPILTQTAGLPFTTTLTAMDAYDNISTNFSGTVVLTDTTSTISPTEVMCDKGVWEGPATILRAHTGVTITASESGFQRGESNAFNVLAGPMAGFAFDPVPVQTVGISFTIDITAVDAYDNRIEAYTGTNTLTDTTGTITPTFTPAFSNGAVQLLVTINRVQSGVVMTTTGAGKTGVSNAFDVSESTWDVYLPLVVRNN